MKNYKDSDVLKVLEKTNFSKIKGNEYFEKYSCYSDYVITDNKIYSSEEISDLSENERNRVLSSGFAINESYLYSLMNYQHIIDNNSNLEKGQRELLRVLLKSEMHFIPFSFGDWNDGLHVIEKLNLVKLLLDGKWSDGYCTSYLDEDIYFITMKFERYLNKKDFSYDYVVKNDEDFDTFKNLEIYIPYSDFVSIYKNVFNCEKSKFWESHINRIDL